MSMVCQTWTSAVPVATPVMICPAFTMPQTPELRYCSHDRPLVLLGIG
jgi:hypothetical protein